MPDALGISFQSRALNVATQWFTGTMRIIPSRSMLFGFAESITTNSMRASWISPSCSN